MAQIAVTALSPILPEDLTTSNNIVTFTADGDTNQVAFFEAVSSANSANNCVCIKSASLTITSAQVLALNSTPLTIVAAQGAGTAIEVISASVKVDFNTTAYATNTTILITTSGAAQYQSLFNSAVLASASSTFNSVGKSALAGTNLISNADLTVTVGTGAPTGGNSGITVYITYRVITL